MIYNAKNTAGIGRPVEVFDANGLKWDRLIECDTETGRIVRHVRDESGNFVLNGSEIAREEQFVAAPLSVVPLASYPITQEFTQFCEREFPRWVTGWTREQLRIAGVLADFQANRGLHVVEVPRGAGTTTLVEMAYRWFESKGDRFPIVIGRHRPDFMQAENKYGILGSLRGLTRKFPGGDERVRPSVVFVDNPAHNSDNKSAAKCAQICGVIEGVLPSLGGQRDVGVMVFVCREFDHFLIELERRCWHFRFHRMEPGSYCADCGMSPYGPPGPPDGWQLEDGRTVCHACCAKDTRQFLDAIAMVDGKAG